ncbi:thiamine diphosphokinase [Paenibacillus protaetiae]|uniref:Thiamine diphosphokinase n=1 Tax=Paenibacillus protaetiae TaxID=2509456 RepID=A0A4P6F6I9_9BACL|nr:thiamine diphosphokinase [Paenibacillus protaetiae]QAY66028.1 thiamine diphosphokinase [Paenibacillus protaetiae]
MHKRIVICSGGELGRWALPYIENCSYLIGADKGALFLAEHGFRPDIALGDFDSVTAGQLALIRNSSRKVEDCDPIDKNYTDTELAFRHALSLNPGEIVLLGATGTRLDHTLANMHLLAAALQQGTPAAIIDRHNHISLTDSRLTLSRSGYRQISLLPLTMRVTGITLTGFQYPLHNAVLNIGQSLGISNVLAEETGTIQVSEGMLLVIQSND